MYSWIPFFSEWFDKLSTYRNRQPELVQLLIRAGVKKGLTDVHGTPPSSIELTEIDPFTATNAVLKHGDVNCTQIFSNIAKEIGMTTALPTDYDGVPRPSSLNFWYFPGKDKRPPGQVPALWDLFEAARKGMLSAGQYDAALEMQFVGPASLTQALFRLDPGQFFPVDSQTIPFLDKQKIQARAHSYHEYRRTLEEVKKLGSAFPELSRRAWIEQRKPYEGVMKEGAIRQGYIPIGRPGFFDARYYGGSTDAEAGASFALQMPGGETYQTDIRRQGLGGRIRTRFGALFRKLGLQPGAIFKIVRIDDDHYQLTFSQPEAPAPQADGAAIESVAVAVAGGPPVVHPLNQILYGPPGSGKTYATAEIAVGICDGFHPAEREDVMERFNALRREGRIAFVTFHPSFGYEDFVEGIRFDKDSGTPEIKDGVFKALCQTARRAGAPSAAAAQAAASSYVLIVDEINRGNISKIFGELITLLEPDKRVTLDNDDTAESIEVVLPYSRDVFGVPENVYVVGTMNTADRSIATLDLALRRRFQFIDCPPDVDAIDPAVVDRVNLQALLVALNQRIEYLLDRDHLLGHAYFMGIGHLKELQAVFAGKVIPLLQEYFFDDWSKIALVLKGASQDSHFLLKDAELDPAVIFGGKGGLALRDKKASYRIADPQTWTASVFQELYAHLPGQADASNAHHDDASPA